MNSKLLILSLGILSVVGCSSSDSAFTDTSTGVVQSTGVISQKGIQLQSNDTDPTAYDVATSSLAETTLTLSVTIWDRNNIQIKDANKTIYFRTEWGFFNSGGTQGGSCVTNNGKCEIDWTTGDIGSMPVDRYVRFIAYAQGEETFIDINDNKFFDDGDIFDIANPDHDIEEPYLDCNHNGQYDDGTAPPLDEDPLIDVTIINGLHDSDDNLYNGAGCQHSTLCSGTTLIQVSDTLLIDLDGSANANPALGNDTTCD